MLKKVMWYGKELEIEVADVSTQAISKGCFYVERDAKPLCPFKTSRLKNSISSNWYGSGMNKGKVAPPAKAEDGIEQPTKKLTGYVGSNVEYARRIELGFVGTDSLGRKYNQKPRPYLRPALEKNRKRIMELFNNKIK